MNARRRRRKSKASSSTANDRCQSFALPLLTLVPSQVTKVWRFRVELMGDGNTLTTVLRPFFWNHPGEPVPEKNFWTLWCKGRLTEADTLTIRLGTTPSGLTSAHLHHPPIFFTDRMPFLPPNQQCQSTEGPYKQKRKNIKNIKTDKHTSTTTLTESRLR